MSLSKKRKGDENPADRIYPKAPPLPQQDSVLLKGMSTVVRGYVVTSTGKEHESFDSAIRSEASRQLKDLFNLIDPYDNDNGRYSCVSLEGYNAQLRMLSDMLGDKERYEKLKEVIDEFYHLHSGKK
jgi:hypothetical protein